MNKERKIIEPEDNSIENIQSKGQKEKTNKQAKRQMEDHQVYKHRSLRRIKNSRKNI